MNDGTDDLQLEDSMNRAVGTAVEHEEEVIRAEGDLYDEGHDHGLTDLGYVKVAIFLAVVTAAEVLMSYTIDTWGVFFLPILLTMMVVKFFVVVLFFMHLKFDNRLFSIMFYMGLVLAVGVYVVALFTFKFFDS